MQTFLNIRHRKSYNLFQLMNFYTLVNKKSLVLLSEKKWVSFFSMNIFCFYKSGRKNIYTQEKVVINRT